MKKSISSLALLFALATNSNAANYTVQVGAYKTLNQEAIEQAQNHGEVFQSTGRDNLERLSIGRFNNRRDANNMRDKLQASGFNGAFIVTLDDNSISASQDDSFSTTQHDIAQQSSQRTNSVYTMNDLSADERVKATFLDGQLRILSEGSFYTVEQYRQNSRY